MPESIALSPAPERASGALERAALMRMDGRDVAGRNALCSNALPALQLEAFIETVLLKLAEGKGITRIEQQEAALEVGSA